MPQCRVSVPPPWDPPASSWPCSSSAACRASPRSRKTPSRPSGARVTAFGHRKHLRARHDQPSCWIAFDELVACRRPRANSRSGRPPMASCPASKYRSAAAVGSQSACGSSASPASGRWRSPGSSSTQRTARSSSRVDVDHRRGRGRLGRGVRRRRGRLAPLAVKSDRRPRSRPSSSWAWTSASTSSSTRPAARYRGGDQHY